MHESSELDGFRKGQPGFSHLPDISQKVSVFQLFKKDTSVTDDIPLRNLSCWYYLRKIMIKTNALGGTWYAA